jgi:hypothetical protein
LDVTGTLTAGVHSDDKEGTVTQKRKRSAPQSDGTPQETAAPEWSVAEVDRELIALAEQANANATSNGDHEVATGAPPAPDPLATAWTELDLRCPTCSIVHYVPICTMLNAQESPGLVQRLIAGHFNLKRCPICHKVEFVEYPFVYYDPTRKLAVQVRPEWEWHAGGGEEWYAARLEDFFERWAAYDVQIDVVFGPERLIQRFLQPVSTTTAQPASTTTE